MVFPLYLVLNTYRFIIGGEGIYQSLIFSTLIFLVVPLLSRNFIRQNSHKRIFYAIVATISLLCCFIFLH